MIQSPRTTVWANELFVRLGDGPQMALDRLTMPWGGRPGGRCFTDGAPDGLRFHGCAEGIGDVQQIVVPVEVLLPQWQPNHLPPARHREPARVFGAQIVGVGFGHAGQGPQHRSGVCVGVRQRGHRGPAAPVAAAVAKSKTSHLRHSSRPGRVRHARRTPDGQSVIWCYRPRRTAEVGRGTGPLRWKACPATRPPLRRPGAAATVVAAGCGGR